MRLHMAKRSYYEALTLINNYAGRLGQAEDAARRRHLARALELDPGLGEA